MPLVPTLAATLLALAASVHAQSTTDQAAQPAPGATAAAEPPNDAEVRKVDKAQGKLTLKHGPIKSLDMPGMTMVFRVSDPKLLDNLNQGDKVRFAAENINGAVTVTAIRVVR